MTRAQYPLIVRASRPVRAALGPKLSDAGVAAFRAALLKARGAEMAFMQILYDGFLLAFSTRIGAQGDVIVEMDEGNPALGAREMTEEQMRRAEDDARQKRRG